MKDDDDRTLEALGNEAREARIVAWVLGEASPFEAVEIEALCAGDAELGLFAKRMRELHGLVSEAEKPEAGDAWRLTEGKRRAVVDLLGVEPVVVGKRSHFPRQALLAVAACLMATLIALPLFLNQRKAGEVMAMAPGYVAPGARTGAPGGAEDGRRLLFRVPAAPAPVDSVDFFYSEAKGGAELGEGKDLRANLHDFIEPTGSEPAQVRFGKESEMLAAPVVPRGLELAAAGTRSADGAVSRFSVDQPLNVPGQADGFAERGARVAGETAVEYANQVGGDRFALGLEFGTGWTAAETLANGPGQKSWLSEAPLATYAGRSLQREGAAVEQLRLGEGQGEVGNPLEEAMLPDLKGVEANQSLATLDGPRGVDPTSPGEPAAEVEELRRKLYTAEGHLNLGRFKDAKNDYEEALRTDPESLAARRGLEKAQAATTTFYQAGFDTTRAELLAEVDAAWKLAPPPEQEAAVAAVELLPSDSGLDAMVLFDDVIEEEVRQLSVELPAGMAEVSAAEEPFSTFSLHVSDASFKLAVAAIERGELPAAESVRPEEFYNAFDYGDPSPANGEPVACVVEQCAHPVLPQRNLLRIAVRTGAEGRAASVPLNLTLLLDNSGSMERDDRAAGVKGAVEQLTSLLKEGDTVTVAGFSRQPRLLADRIDGKDAERLNGVVTETPAEGGTNLEEALKLGEELAKRQFAEGAQNRLVLFTDGAANLGDADPESLNGKVEGLRSQGIAFDAAGFGADGLNDRLLERLTRNGNGRYYIVDGAEDADSGFARQLAGAFRPAAENVKVQVRFNPERVGSYKLIGFEEHRLQKEDFRNDAVDAAEMASEEAGVALYQFEVMPQGEGEVGEVSVRFRDAASGRMVERTWTIPYDARAVPFDEAPPSLELAGLAAFAAEKLRDAPMSGAIDFSAMSDVVAKVKSRYTGDPRITRLTELIEKLRQR